MSDSLSSTSSDCSSTCTVHGHCVVYYCRDCRVTVCGTCVTDSSHRKHEFETLTKGFELHIEAVAERVKTLNKTMKEQTNIKPRVLKARDELEDMFNLAKEKVAEQYHELRELMDQNMQQAFMLILALRERMIQDTDQLVQFGEEYEEKRKHIQCSVKALKRTQDTDDGAIISKIEEVEAQIEEIEDYHRNVFEIITFDKQRLKALEHSISKIVQMNKDLLPRPWEFGENITFDDGASHEHLKISRDKTKVQYVASQSSNKRRKRKQIETVFNVLASQSFTEGRHYWEVNVKNTKCWTVGVVEKDWVKKGIKQVLGQDMLSWVLQMDGDSLVALHKHDTTMITEAVIERLGVFLDFKKGRLQFFNVHRGTVLHTFVEKFKNPLVPAFSIESQKGSTPEMRLCVLVLRDMDRNYDSGQRRESTDSGNGRAFNSSSSATGRSSQSSSPLTTESTARL
ncbi:tripartite motif-containing protein 75-like [Conger conger]|uniref:tripartite motif-containing protein 75-like n=1 Tax=Conger conger TaxID=82655 RepID=UPI002A5A4E90|nr:tripartite motif-containing protein 75-like [Conger conger]